MYIDYYMSENIILCKEIKNKPKKYCIFEDCKTQPYFNIKGKTKGLYCYVHKKENMINVNCKICIFEGCNTQPNYNFKDEKIAMYCYVHKQKIKHVFLKNVKHNLLIILKMKTKHYIG